MAIAAAQISAGAASYCGICDLRRSSANHSQVRTGLSNRTDWVRALGRRTRLYIVKDLAINHVGGISTAAILFQGADDYVVPK